MKKYMLSAEFLNEIINDVGADDPDNITIDTAYYLLEEIERMTFTIDDLIEINEEEE